MTPEQIVSYLPIERQVNVFTNLNMAQVKNLIAAGETGYLGALYSLYEYIESSDSRIQGMLSVRRKSVSKNKYQITASDPEHESVKFIRDNIKHLRWKTVIESLVDARLYGMVGLLKHYGQDKDGRIIVDKITQIDKTKFAQANYLTAKRTGEPIIYKYQYGNEHVTVHDLLDRNLILFGSAGNIAGKYDMAGTMRSIGRWFVIKQFAIQSWALFAEKYGFPVAVMKATEADYNKNKATAIKLLQSVGANRYAYILKDMDFETVSANGANNVDVFKQLINEANTEMAIGILGQNLTTEVKGGSLAAADIHDGIKDDIVTADIQFVDEIINDQFIRPLIALNFPELDEEDYPRYETEVDTPFDVQAEITALTLASNLIPIGKKHIYDRLRIPAPEEDEETIGGADSLMNAVSGLTN